MTAIFDRLLEPIEGPQIGLGYQRRNFEVEVDAPEADGFTHGSSRVALDLLINPVPAW